MQAALQLTQGSVIPLGIINDVEGWVALVIDKDLSGQRLLFHPNRNDRTMFIMYDDLLKFIQCEGNRFVLL